MAETSDQLPANPLLPPQTPTSILNNEITHPLGITRHRPSTNRSIHSTIQGSGSGLKYMASELEWCDDIENRYKKKQSIVSKVWLNLGDGHKELIYSQEWEDLFNYLHGY